MKKNQAVPVLLTEKMKNAFHLLLMIREKTDIKDDKYRLANVNGTQMNIIEEAIVCETFQVAVAQRIRLN